MLKIIFLQGQQRLQQCAAGEARLRQTGQIQGCKVSVEVPLQQLFCLRKRKSFGVAFVDAAV